MLNNQTNNFHYSQTTPIKGPFSQTLLSDWLKLNTKVAQQLAQPIQAALGLLYWLESVN